MGLDMNLYREVQLKGKMKITDEKLEGMLDGDLACPSVRQSVGTWRKFNALHKYFADNFNEQDNDNCVDMYMDFDDIVSLLEKLKALRKDIKLGDGWVANGWSMESVKNDTPIKMLDGSTKKAFELQEGDLILVNSNGEEKRAVVNYTRFTDKDNTLNYSFTLQEKGTVVLNSEICKDVLPTEDGFFFGSTDYDEYYVNNIDDTIEQLSKVIDEHKELISAGVAPYDINYYYRAWY